MTNQRNELAKKLDEKAYYEYIRERDKKRKERIERIVSFILHLTGTHVIDYSPTVVYLGKEARNFYKCKVCKAEFTSDGLKVQAFKWFATLVGLVSATAVNEAIGFYKDQIFLVLFPLLILHLATGIINLFACVREH